MTEREKMLHAKSYLDRLAEGTDPLTGQDLPSDSVLGKAQMVRCFFYVSELIEQFASILNEDGTLKTGASKSASPSRAAAKRAALTLTPEQLQAVPLGEDALPISVLTKRITDAVSQRLEHPVNIPAIWITAWLADRGYLCRVEAQGINAGKTEKIATELGQRIGIITVDSTLQNGQKVHKNLYSKAAQ